MTEASAITTSGPLQMAAVDREGRTVEPMLPLLHRSATAVALIAEVCLLLVVASPASSSGVAWTALLVGIGCVVLGATDDPDACSARIATTVRGSAAALAATTAGLTQVLADFDAPGILGRADGCVIAVSLALMLVAAALPSPSPAE